MLLRYPGLTIIGVVAMAFAIATGASVFEFLNQVTRPRLPLVDGDRIVGLRLRDTASRTVEEHAAFDFAIWRREVTSIEDLGAFRTVDRNLVAAGGPSEPIQLAEISASGFRVMRVPALIGRSLVDADEQANAPPVVVLGYGVWQSRFGGDPAVLGQTVRLGTSPVTVVGIMPKDFKFPVAHDAWIPLQLNSGEFAARQGPEIHVFGRLASDSGFDKAEAELNTIGSRLAGEYPYTHQYLRPEVLPYAQSIRDVGQLEAVALLSINVFLIMLLLLVCGNIALLMFARAATRETEIVVRTALGAGRTRIIGQLFAEAFVLAALAAPAGLAAARLLLQWWLTVSAINAGGRLPFWRTASLAPSTIVYVVGLTLLGAIVAGVVPALKVTGRRIEARLRQMTAGGGGLHFGGVWTAVIVLQVAVTLAFPAAVFLVRQAVVDTQSFDAGFPLAEFLSARLEINREERSASSTHEELERRLNLEPGVVGVTFTSRLPRTSHPRRWMEIDEAGSAVPASDRGLRVNPVFVAVNYFDALGVRVLSGRAFQPSDLSMNSGPVVVNQSFVQLVLQGRNAVGRRVRYLDDRWQETGAVETQEPWHEIVGVLPDVGTIHDETQGAIYHPMSAASDSPAYIAVHVRGEPGSFASRLRVIAADVDPTLRLYDVMPLSRVGADTWNELDFLWRLLLMLSSLAIILSLSGIYSAVSFAVSRRHREIGIRVALGALPHGIVTAILRQPLFQVGLGVLAGFGLVLALVAAISSSGLSLVGAAWVVAYAIVMMGVCMLACIVPIRRALRVEPTEALRVSG